MSKNRVPERWMPMYRPLRTHVIGVGCGAGRAMNRLWTTRRLDEVACIVVNTDRDALQDRRASTKILLEVAGRDAGGNSEIGRRAGVAAYEQLVGAVQGADVVLLIATLGGGTGSGVAPLVAEIAKAQGCLTVAVVTLPFLFEGTRRLATAEQGRQALQARVDTLLTIPSQRLLSCMDRQTSLREAYRYGDEVVQHAVSSVLQAITCTDDRALLAAAQANLATAPLVQAITRADARAFLAGMGQACVGTGVARGEHRGAKAAWRAVTSPLLESSALAEARAVLLSLSGGPDLTQVDVSDATSVVREMTLADVLIRPSSSLTDSSPGELWVTILAASSPLGG